MNKSRYTLAFIFNRDLSKVLLISKKRPAWQSGLLNGIGGKLEENELPLNGIKREVEEETNLYISKEQFKYVAQLEGKDWIVHVYSSIYEKEETDVKNLTDEISSWYEVASLPKNVINNLTFLIPLCLDIHTAQEIELAHIKYST